VDFPAVIYKLTPAGKLTTLYTFASGVIPSGLIQATDGDFYGTTYNGGANSLGQAFKITSTGTFTTLYSFCEKASCTDGADPEGGVIQGNDGNFYGVAGEGGANGSGTLGGTVYQLTPAGVLTTLYNFCSQPDCADGSNPVAPPVQGTDGNFYGLAGPSGGGHNGVIYKLTTGLTPFVKPVPTSGKVGTNVTILGDNLTGSTAVTFNGTAATFTVVSATEITATVPTGATTGNIEVTTPTATLSSNVPFRVP